MQIIAFLSLTFIFNGFYESRNSGSLGLEIGTLTSSFFIRRRP
jgi:hypothetical protein